MDDKIDKNMLKKKNMNFDLRPMDLNYFLEYMDKFEDMSQEEQDAEDARLEKECPVAEETEEEYKAAQERRAQYHRDVEAMEPTEHFLHVNGFDDVFGRHVQNLIDNTDAGKQILDRFDNIGHGSRDDLRAVLHFFIDHDKDFAHLKSKVDAYMINEDCMGYYGGILGCSERILRTIHKSCRQFVNYCESSGFLTFPEPKEV